MGVDVADYDHSGRPSIWVTNYENEPHALYHNDLRNGNLMFSWKTTGSGIAALGQRNVSWGTGFGDLDRDGYEDIFIVNGHAIRYPGGFEKNQKMRPVLLRNSGDGKFHQATQLGGSFFNSQHRSRGAVLVDLNNSGSLDLVVSNVNEPVAILQGLTPPDTHWVGICLQRHDNLDIVKAKGFKQGVAEMEKFLLQQVFIAGLKDEIRNKVMEANKTKLFETADYALDVETIIMDKKRAASQVMAVHQESDETKGATDKLMNRI